MEKHSLLQMAAAQAPRDQQPPLQTFRMFREIWKKHSLLQVAAAQAPRDQQPPLQTFRMFREIWKNILFSKWPLPRRQEISSRRCKLSGCSVKFGKTFSSPKWPLPRRQEISSRRCKLSGCSVKFGKTFSSPSGRCPGAKRSAAAAANFQDVP